MLGSGMLGGGIIIGGGIFNGTIFGGGIFMGGKISVACNGAGHALTGVLANDRFTGDETFVAVGDLFDGDRVACKFVRMFIGMLFGILSGKLIEGLVGVGDGEASGELTVEIDDKAWATMAAGEFRPTFESLARRGSEFMGNLSNLEMFSGIVRLASTLPISGLNAAKQRRKS